MAASARASSEVSSAPEMDWPQQMLEHRRLRHFRRSRSGAGNREHRIPCGRDRRSLDRYTAYPVSGLLQNHLVLDLRVQARHHRAVFLVREADRSLQALGRYSLPANEMSDPDPGVPPGRFLGPLPFELNAVALHGRLALGEDRDHVEGRTGPQSREQRLHRTHAERDLLPVYDDLVPGPVLAHVPRATQMSDSHSRVRHLATLHYGRTARRKPRTC